MPNYFVDQDNVEHGDSPWCHVEWLCKPGLTSPELLLLVRAIMPPGKGHNFHWHPGREEIVYVISGTAEQWVGEEKRIMQAGDSAHVPREMVHATYNVGEDPLVFLAVLGPAETGSEDFTLDASGEEPWKSLREPVIN